MARDPNNCSECYEYKGICPKCYYDCDHCMKCLNDMSPDTPGENKCLQKSIDKCMKRRADSDNKLKIKYIYLLMKFQNEREKPKRKPKQPAMKCKIIVEKKSINGGKLSEMINSIKCDSLFCDEEDLCDKCCGQELDDIGTCEDPGEDHHGYCSMC